MSAGVEPVLLKLGESTAEAAAGVLEAFAPGRLQLGGVTVVDGSANPLDGIHMPAVASAVSYVDGVTGGNVVAMPLEAARQLAAAMMGLEAPEDPDAPELSELELSAVAEAANQMMASAAAATSAVLGSDVEIGPPDSRTFASEEEAAGAYPDTPHAVRVTFSIADETCRLVQLVPNAFVVRMTRALDQLAGEPAPTLADSDVRGTAMGVGRPSLAGIPVRVWAELGRARLPSADIVALPPGGVVELDRQVDDAIDLYVNGSLFATGRLVVVDGSDWAVRIETVLPHPVRQTEMEVASWPESS